jgi:hypothetical protein
MGEREIAAVFDVMAQLFQQPHDARRSQHRRTHRAAGDARSRLDWSAEDRDRLAARLLDRDFAVVVVFRHAHASPLSTSSLVRDLTTSGRKAEIGAGTLVACPQGSFRALDIGRRLADGSRHDAFAPHRPDLHHYLLAASWLVRVSVLMTFREAIIRPVPDGAPAPSP